MDYNRFWALLGTYSYSGRLSVAEYIEKTAQSWGSTIEASWADATQSEMEIKVGSGEKMLRCVAVVNANYIKHFEIREPGLIGTAILQDTQEINGKTVPRTFTCSISSDVNVGTWKYEFSEFAYLEPDKVDLKQLIEISPIVGTEVVDLTTNKAYRVTSKGPEYTPFTDPLIGKITINDQPYAVVAATSVISPPDASTHPANKSVGDTTNRETRSETNFPLLGLGVIVALGGLALGLRFMKRSRVA
jgi:hypothetical protein